MSNPSNLYAEKVFAEHPIALWALDDQADYISLISEEDRDMSAWTYSGISVSELVGKISPLNSIVNEIFTTTSQLGIHTASLVSQDIVNLSSLNSSLKTFCIGGYFYSESSAISSVELGYEYYDETTAQTVQNTKTFSTTLVNEWMFASETFEVPDQNVMLRIVAKINYFSSSDENQDHVFLINGITFGQWSEEFNSTSIGLEKELIPSGIFKTGTHYGIPAYPYGIDNLVGYYVVADNTLVAKNTGIPMVYGATGITRLVPNNGLPSLIFPGCGFLHENGKYREYTFEMWIKISNDSSEPKKIFGPIQTGDGLYVDGPLLILKINDYLETYYIGEWGKPMLVDIRYSPLGANVLLNGEQIISINFNASDIDFLYRGSTTPDWLGVWAYTDINPVEVDGVAIYPYQVPPVVAKRRYVYGQGVDIPENINTAYSGSSVYIDYQYSDYANNYIYPDLGKWNNGLINNLSIVDDALSLPDYKLPDIKTENSNEYTLKLLSLSEDIQTEDETFFTFKPNEAWEENGYMYFDNFSLLNEDVKAIYSIIKINDFPSQKETLISVQSKTSSDHFDITINGSTITYSLTYNGIETILYNAYSVDKDVIFPIGIDIDRFSEFFGESTLPFFGNKSNLSIYVGGNKEFGNSFTGNIYSFGMCNAENLLEVQHLFNSKGCVIEYEDVFDLYDQYIDYDAGEYTGSDVAFWQYFLDGGSPADYPTYRLKNHTATYTLFVKHYFDAYYLDIAIKGSWKDYIPLTYFAKYINTPSGDSVYDMDFIQFNIDYPAPTAFIESMTESVDWKYGVPTVIGDEVIPSLQETFSLPTQKTYEYLDNKLYTGYNDYSDLKNRSSKQYLYDTSKSMIKTYITFEYLSSSPNSSESYFSNIVSAPKNGVISPGSEWLNTKYEVVDNMIIYPPAEDLHSLAIVTRINFHIDGINTHKVSIKSLEFASQSFDEVSPNAVGTRFGIPIYPYVKNGYYYNYKYKNPFAIYKKSSPYLYMTKNSGIGLKGDILGNVDRGLSIPINQSRSSVFKVMAMQAAIKYDQDFFPYSPMKIFEVEGLNQHIKFYLVANASDGKRAKIYAINAKTGKPENGIGFYWNGKIVKDPVLTVKEWGFLGISFSNLIDFGNSVGSIRITGPLLFNTISYYKATTLQEIQNVVKRPWFKVKYANQNILDWQFWNPIFQWGDVLVISSKSYYGVDPETVYKSYTGTNKIIVDDTEKLSFGSYAYRLYQDVDWTNVVANAI